MRSQPSSISRGHDVTLLPVYTPTLTDEPNVSGDKVFFGGISVYLEQYVPFFRRSPKWMDSLWDSSVMLSWRLVVPFRRARRCLVRLTVSMLKGDDGFQRKEILKLLDWLKDEGPPDVVSLPYTLLLGLANQSKRRWDARSAARFRVKIFFSKVWKNPTAVESEENSSAQISSTSTLLSPSATTTRNSCRVIWAYRRRRFASYRLA